VARARVQGLRNGPVATGIWSAVARATDGPFTAQWAHRFRVKDGKVTYFQGYEDTAVIAAALRQEPFAAAPDGLTHGRGRRRQRG
jgi:hypothetical protein